MGVEIKIVPMTVQKTVYVATDGREFDEEDEAIVHETGIKAREAFGLTNADIESGGGTYVILKSAEEAKMLHTYIYDHVGCCCTFCFDPDASEYPLLAVYDDEAELHEVEEKDYEQSKNICSLYERVQRLKCE